MIRGGAVVIPVADVATAVRFYIETLGMKLVVERTNESLIDAGEGFVLSLRKGDRRNGAGVDLYTKVPLAQAKAIYENRGVVFDGDDFADPDGNRFHLTEG
jgi:catechol 2,3-dioxygenase-like lactoylglutathione lyase family enzyme